MKKKLILGKLFLIYPSLKKNPHSKINKEIFNYLWLFVRNQDILTASLIQNPFRKTTGLKNIRKKYGENIHDILICLNGLHNCNKEIFKKYKENKQVILLFLSNLVVLLERHPGDSGTIRLVKTPEIKFAMKLLENLDITEIKIRLEDKLFSLLEPNLYRNYHSLLELTRKKFILQQKKIAQEFKALLKSSGIEARIESRLKTIYSVHQKILKKNILFSQILDTIGIRIIVKTEDDCYKAMVLILKQGPIISSHVKDYIAIPKDNGYQSIHLAILHEGHPVEIQIRTFEMHQRAQYGPASHFEYKKLSPEISSKPEDLSP